MNPISTIRKAAFLSTLMCSILHSRSQVLYPVSIEQKIQQSSLVAEGRVLSQESFWNPQHTAIFTSSKVEVYKIFKGAVSRDTIDVMTQGGQVGNEGIVASDVLKLRKNETGLFFCYPNQLHLTAPRTGNTLYDVYSSSQGVLKYNLSSGSAYAPFAEYNRIEEELYPVVQKLTGRAFVNRKPSFRVSVASGLRPMQTNAISLTSFSPATVTAGTIYDAANNILTITGSGFGTGTAGYGVLFDAADDGLGNGMIQVNYNDPLVISWTNTSIQLHVPSGAGTGFIAVTDGAGTTTASATMLNVWYGIHTGTFTDGNGTATRELNLMNRNGSGGYTVTYCTSTANGGADITASAQVATFQRAMATWKELTGANIIESGATTTTQTANPNDGTNIIMLDNTSTGWGVLPAGTLAVCHFGYGACGTLFAYYITGFDIVIRNPGTSVGSTSFLTGPCPDGGAFSNYDLETTILHELGHALNLEHINDAHQCAGFPNCNPNKLMNYALVNGVKRTSPDYSAYQGVLYSVAQQGNNYGCAFTEMTPLSTTVESKDECPVTFPSTALAAGTTVPFDLVHATSDKNADPQFTALNCTGTGTGVTNTAFYPFKTGGAGTMSITVSGYGTTPAAQSACSGSGVEMALYQVSSCPTGQSFPAPVQCATFNANGVVNFTGLAASTNYLLVTDGIANTKAAFNLAFAGASLPIKLNDFTGTAFSNYNQLYWTFDQFYNVQQIVVEKSGDGQTFDAVGSLSAASLANKGTFKDVQPFMGDNYYRLAIVNVDGSKEYTTVVLLKRKDNLLVSAWPNPVHDILNVELNGITPGAYSFILYNTMGQQVQHTRATLNAYRQIVPINAGRLAAGMYHLAVYNAKGIPVSETKIEVR